jgi:drug/metabolite transporter (DMT)-like permease
MDPRSPEHPRAVAALIGAAFCWSIGGVLIKYLHWPPLAIAGGRGLIAAFFLAATHRPLRFTWSWLQIAAAIAYTACTVSFVTATKLTTAANAILLQYTAPVYVAWFGSWFLGEKTTRIDWITIAVVFAGMALFFGDGLEWSHVAGNSVAIASGVCFATMTLLLRKQKSGSPIESIILGNCGAALIGLPLMLSAPAPSLAGWAALLVLGVVQLGVSYLLYARAIRHVTALEAVLIPVIEPILNPVWTFLILHERPGPWALAGGAVVVSAVTVRALISIGTVRLSASPVARADV